MTDRDPFCPGLTGREECETCAGRALPEEMTIRIRAHTPWPFAPCPHHRPCPQYEPAADKEGGPT